MDDGKIGIGDMYIMIDIVYIYTEQTFIRNFKDILLFNHQEIPNVIKSPEKGKKKYASIFAYFFQYFQKYRKTL